MLDRRALGLGGVNECGLRVGSFALIRLALWPQGGFRLWTRGRGGCIVF